MVITPTTEGFKENQKLARLTSLCINQETLQLDMVVFALMCHLVVTALILYMYTRSAGEYANNAACVAGVHLRLVKVKYLCLKRCHV